jgi:hypothetical protein
MPTLEPGTVRSSIMKTVKIVKHYAPVILGLDKKPAKVQPLPAVKAVVSVPTSLELPEMTDSEEVIIAKLKEVSKAYDKHGLKLTGLAAHAANSLSLAAFNDMAPDSQTRKDTALAALLAAGLTPAEERTLLIDLSGSDKAKADVVINRFAGPDMTTGTWRKLKKEEVKALGLVWQE